MRDQVSIALIGAGRTGTPLLKDLLAYSYIRVLGVADVDMNSPGMQLAREHGLACYQEPMQMVREAGEVDILVEVSGDTKLKHEIKQYYEQTNNHHTIIMHDLIARLIISLCDRAPALVPTHHPEDDGIG